MTKPNFQSEIINATDTFILFPTISLNEMIACFQSSYLAFFLSKPAAATFFRNPQIVPSENLKNF